MGLAQFYSCCEDKHESDQHFNEIMGRIQRAGLAEQGFSAHSCYYGLFSDDLKVREGTSLTTPTRITKMYAKFLHDQKPQ